MHYKTTFALVVGLGLALTAGKPAGSPTGAAPGKLTAKATGPKAGSGAAAGTDGEGADAPAHPAESEPPPGVLEKRVQLAPVGLAYGQSVTQVSKVYGRYFERLYVPKYQRVSVGPATAALDYELEQRKRVIRQNAIVFGSQPVGLDQTALRYEYPYKNDESLTSVSHPGGTKRYLFFFSDRMWKVYDEYQLREKRSALGATFEEAVVNLQSLLNDVPPIRVEADFAKKQYYAEARWEDPLTSIRLIDRSAEKVVGLVLEDRRVSENLESYRKNDGDLARGVDQSVEDVTR